MKRAFVYGDLLFETIRVTGGKICYPDLHLKRLNLGFTVLQMHAMLPLQEFETRIYASLKDKKEARVRFMAYREGEGYYLPKQNEVAYEIAVSDLPEGDKICSHLGIFPTYRKGCHALSNIKTGNALVSVMASKHAEIRGWNDAVLLNEKGNVCEATGSNIFIIRDGTIFTPPLSEGCVMGVMREVVLEKLKLLDRLVVEEAISMGDLENAEEVFLTNTINGIVPVQHLDNKALSSSVARLLLHSE